ncbi:hypothetical protein [Paenibacillus protaetiae]|nr:hypothetical protein [Paenibacillus protaetiae]
MLLVKKPFLQWTAEEKTQFGKEVLDYARETGQLKKSKKKNRRQK